MQPIEIKAPIGGTIILRVNIKSNILAPAVIQPTLDHWVKEDGNIFIPEFNVEPAYSLLQTGGEAKVMFTIKVPKETVEGDMLYGVLIIPGAESYEYPIQLEITKYKKTTKKVVDITTTILVPPKVENGVESENSVLVSKSTIKLLGGLASLEVIPSKWIVSELIIRCCSLGYQSVITSDGAVKLDKLSRTRFYKNGVLIFQGTQFVQWIKFAYTISSGLNTIAGGTKLDGSILQNWEEWLFNLLDQDVESPEFDYQKIDLPNSVSSQKVLEVMGVDPEVWFGYLLLGLCQLSPRISHMVDQLTKDISVSVPKKIVPKQKPKNVLKEKGSIQR